MQKYRFIDLTVHLVRVKLHKKLPANATIEKFIEKSKELLKEIYDEEVKNNGSNPCVERK